MYLSTRKILVPPDFGAGPRLMSFIRTLPDSNADHYDPQMIIERLLESIHNLCVRALTMAK